MQDLHTLTTPSPTGTDGYDFEVPTGWQQGRGAFGGLVVAMLVRAVEAHVGAPDRALRSLSVEIPGATVLGPARVRVETLRAGSGVSAVAARLIQQDEVRAYAVAVLGRARNDEAPTCALTPPSPRPWREMTPLPHNEFTPTFAQHFEFRSDGPFPFTGGEPRTEGWLRAKNPGPLGAAVRIATYADVWWPAVFTILTGPRPIGTVAYMLQIVGSLEGLDPEAPLFHRARAVATSEGYSSEHRELWGEDGRLIALNTQTIAMIR